MASASLFCLNAPSGYLSLAAASAGNRLNGTLPRPTSATVAAPFRIRRRVAARPWVMVIGILLSGSPSQGLQEIDDRVDFLFGQNAISSERGHHGLRVAFAFIRHDSDEIVAVGIFAFQFRQRRSDRARKIAALDLVAGQAIALAAIEGELLPLGNRGLGL